MKRNVLTRAVDYSKKRRTIARRNKILSVVAALVVFCTTYTLIMPAITMEHNKLICGQEEHTHTDECYADQLVLACGQEENGGHTHDDSCYEERTMQTQVLACDEDHEHSDDCYTTETSTESVLVCTEMEGAGHTHDDSCYTLERVLVCGMEEHSHTAECYAKDEEDEELQGSLEAEASENPESEDGEQQDGEDEPNESEPAENRDEPSETENILLLDETYTYEGNDFLRVVFHVKGEVELPQNEEDAQDTEPVEPADDSEEDAQDAESVEPEDDGEEDAQDTEPVEPADDGEEDAQDAESVGPEDDGEEDAQDAEPVEPEDDGEEDAQDAEPVEPELVFIVEEKEDGDAEYDLYAEVAEEDSELLVMSYRLTYGGQELDLSQCEITAEIMPSDLLLELLADSAQTFNAEENVEGVENVLLLTAFEASQDGEVSELDSIYISESDLTVEDGIVMLSLDMESNRPEDEFEPEDASELENKPEDGLEDELEGIDEPVVENIPAEASVMNLNLTGAKTLGTTVTKQVNPEFTVQYFAYLDTVARGAENKPATGVKAEFNVIDTTGGVLPVNTKTPATTKIYLDANGNIIRVGATKVTKVYQERTFQYFKAPNLVYFNALSENDHYEIKQIWILKDGKDPASVDTKDWDVFSYDAVRFTNNPKMVEMTADIAVDAATKEKPKYVLIDEGMVIRLVYETAEGTFKADATFYDYDISDGNHTKSGNVTTMNTDQKGINSATNYSGSGAKYAFGNANSGSGLQLQEWNRNMLNIYNAKSRGGANDAYAGCTFGLVTGVGSDGQSVVFSSGVVAPNIFGTSNITGKTIVTDINGLEFSRKGDTYTLSAVTKANGTTKVGNLETFRNPGPYDGTHHSTIIWTNDFWPMDNVETAKDIMFGYTTSQYSTAYPQTQKYSGKSASNSKVSYNATGNLPVSDDGKNHNSYFGMYYAVDFELSEDYVGPLEYLFFGDDDMWVFLDGKLICDLGGVHSSVGEYVNLWDYLKMGTTGKHTLKFFYTERGASGSSCWMQFTLPTVTSVESQTSGTLTVGKNVDGKSDPDQAYGFEIHIENSNGDLALGTFNVIGEIGEVVETVAIADGSVFELKHGQQIVISGLSLNTTKFTVKELGARIGQDEDGKPIYSNDGYTSYVSVNGELQKTEDGELMETDTAEGAVGSLSSVVFTNSYRYSLPETGGFGLSWMYALGSLLAAAAAATLVYKKLERREGRN